MEESETLMSIDDASEMLGSSRSTVYRWLATGRLKGRKIGRQWRVPRDEVERLLSGEAPPMQSPPGAEEFVEALNRLLTARGAHLETLSVPAPMQAVQAMTRFAMIAGATHFSLEPHTDGEKSISWFRARIDGSLQTHARADLRTHAAVVEAWKRWSGCDPHTEREIQHGRAVLAVGDDGARIDLRVTILPTHLGESLSVTLLDPRRAAEFVDLDRIDFSCHVRARLDEALAAGWGLIAATGATGSGKSSTLYALLGELASAARQSVAIEFVNEWRVPSVIHVPVDPSQGVTVPAAIRATMHTDPDIVMVAELQDQESIDLTLGVALTGHLVLTAVHARRAADALCRIADHAGEPASLSEATRVVVAQDLVRVLCDCSEVEAPSADDLAHAHELCRNAGVNPDDLPQRWRAPRGCASCAHTGFRGRRVIAEALSMDDELRSALRAGAEASTLERIAIDNGMIPIAVDGIWRAAEGETTLREVWRVTRR